MTDQGPELSSEVLEQLPPGPTCSPWDQVKAWIERPVDFWTECQQAYGDTFTIQFGSLGPVVLFCEPEPIHEIFALPSDTFECGSFNEHYQVVMGAKTLLALDGEEHWKQRRLVAPAFQSANSRRWIDRLSTLARQQLQGLRKDEVIHIRRLVHEISFGIVLHLLFGDQHTGIRNFLKKLFLEYMVRDYGTWSPWSRFVSTHQALRALLNVEIRRERAAHSGSCDDEMNLFDQLVKGEAAHDAKADAQIQDHVFTMLIAGVDPSAIASTWALYWIHENQEVLSRLRAEMLRVPDNHDYIQRDDTYLHQVCLEALRMYPVVTTPSGRRLTKGSRIGGRSYSAGVTLLPCTYLAHRREQVFHRADEFRPERFASRSYTSSEFFPFGGGRRVCIGLRLAPITMKTIIVEILQQLDMSPATEGAVCPIRHGTLLAPSDNFRLRIDQVLR